jgi:hypothetical protein
MLKALSLTPWWAWLVVRGLKPIENRKWKTGHRGPFLIHASVGKPKDRKEVVDFIEAAHPSIRVACEALDENLPGDEVPRGGLVGVASIVDLHWNMPSDPWNHWEMAEQYSFILRDVRPIPFLLCPGALSFWKVPAHIYARLPEDVRALG